MCVGGVALDVCEGEGASSAVRKVAAQEGAVVVARAGMSTSCRGEVGEDAAMYLCS